MMISMAGREVSAEIWRPGRPPLDGGQFSMIAIDTETELIKGKVNFPKVVMAQLCNGQSCDLVFHRDLPEYLDVFKEVNTDVKLVFHNVSFDIGVLGRPDWLMEAVDVGRIIDTGLRWQLRNLATEGSLRGEEYPSLNDVCLDVIGHQLNKDEDVRLAFSREVEPTPEQLEYGAYDALTTWLCAYLMPEMPTESTQVKGAMALDEIGRNGLLVDMPRFQEVSKRLIGEYEEAMTSLQDVWGLPVGLKRDKTTPKMIGLMEETLGTSFPSAGKAGVSSAVLSFLTGRLLSYMTDPNWSSVFKSDVESCFDPAYVKSLKKAEWDEYMVGMMLAVETVQRTKTGKPSVTKRMSANVMYRLVNGLSEGAFPDEVLTSLRKEYAECLGWSSMYKQEGVNTVMQRIMEEVEQALGVEFDRTPSGLIATGEEALAKYSVDHPFINSFKRFKHLEKMIGTYLDADKIAEDGRVHPRYMTLVKTGRTSCRNPNQQNVPREPGMREMYKASPGCVLVSVDYNQLELCSLSQDCYLRFGFSVMGDLINKGICVHSYLGGRVSGQIKNKVDPKNDAEVEELRLLIKSLRATPEFDKGPRALAKIADFGFPGGLSPKTFITYAKGFGFDVTLDESVNLYNEWKMVFPEMELHLKPEPMSTGSYADYDMFQVTTYTGRLRVNCGFCAACNNRFQGPAADGAKEVAWELMKYREVYRACCFIHDEFLFELPYDEWLTPRIKHIQSIMKTVMSRTIPSVRIGTEAAVMFNWSKKAEPTFDEDGNYIPFELAKGEIQ